MASASSNHAKAPKCAEFVNTMRAEFPDLKVLHVREGDFELGGEDTAAYATCLIHDTDTD